MSTSEQAARKAELEAREVAESAREKQWRGRSFLKELFGGRYALDLVDPFPVPELDRPAFREFYEKLRAFLETEVDPDAIDREGKYPQHVIDGLAKLGAFGMKIDPEHGGLGLTHPEYVATMRLVGSYDANVTALLSAHQSIGVPQPVKLFGSDAMKRRYLPRCAAGAISAFALTEPAVGSDPARLGTTVRRSDDGRHWILDGEKLWCTNGTIAELLVVMARDVETDRIHCFVVETDWPGVEVRHRCHFMGLRALENGVLRFTSVKVPHENLVGEEGQGLRIALTTLNTGRLTLPAATAGVVARCVETCRKWAKARQQWGRPIGEHEAIAHPLAQMAATAFAMESIAELVGHLADRSDTDIRLEAAAGKEWNTVRAWEELDSALQIRGGRGYETEASLATRGEPPVGIERMLRDARVNLIFEGTSEVMHLFMAREAVDEHLSIAGALVDPKASVGAKLKALPRIALHYLWWYPTRWLGWAMWPRFGRFGKLAGPIRWSARTGRKLARALFHGMLWHRAGLERRQAFLFRLVDIAMEVFAVTASATRAHALATRRDPAAAGAAELALAVHRQAKRRVAVLFRALFRNDDRATYDLGRQVLAAEHTHLEAGIFGVSYDVQELAPEPVQKPEVPRAA